MVDELLPPPPKKHVGVKTGQTIKYSRAIKKKREAEQVYKEKTKEYDRILTRKATDHYVYRKKTNAYKDAHKRAIEALDGKKTTILDTEVLENTEKEIWELIKDRPIIFQPNPGPQTEFLSASEREVFYGGARGGGKSYAMLVDPLRYCDKGNHRALLIRRTMPELRDLIEHSRKLYKQAFPNARFREQEKEWRFPSGARIEFGFAENRTDALRYQGQAYSWIGVDELPQYPTPDVWNDLRGSLRTVDPNIPLFMRACVDEGDVLTEAGWKPIQDVQIGERVFSLDLSNNLILQNVTAVFAYEVDEELVSVNKKSLKMSMTNDHKVVVQKHGSEENYIKPFNKFGSHEKVLRAGFWNGIPYSEDMLNLEANNYMLLLGLFLSEGCTTTRNRITITQVKKYGEDQLYDFFIRCHPKFKKYGADYSLTDKDWYSHFLKFGKAKDKFIPREILNSSKENLENLFEALMFGDGHWLSAKSGSYYTISSQLADDFAELATKLGYNVYITSRYQPLSKNLQYCVYINLNKQVTHIEIKKDDIKSIKYKGKVYCISVANTHNFVIKQKGSVWISSNTGNPGNIGSHWVREMFITPAKWGIPFTVTLETPLGNKNITRRFISAKLADNPYLTQTDDYLIMLASLPEVQRKQWLEGDWDVFENSAFPEFNRAVHVVQPREVPKNWIKFRACDWGYSSNACVLWFACDYDGVLWIYRELYTKLMTADIFARKVLDLEKDDGHVRYGILDASTWAKRGDVGPSIAETMIREGCSWRMSDRSKHSRENGKLEVHRRLSVNPDTKESLIKIFSNCENLIRTLPQLPLDPNNVEDVDTKAEDHAYDALRYGCMSRCLNPSQWFDVAEKIAKYYKKPADPVYGY